MLALENGMTLYHGSYAEVREIELSKCRPGKDFGRGFYLTTSIEQARSFSLLSARKFNKEARPAMRNHIGFVSRFELVDAQTLAFHAFPDADKEWLHFVAGNRRGPLFPDLIAQYESIDVVAGKIANDQTARTLQLYVSGAFGAPGDPRADDTAIALLLPNRLENQYCFRTRKSVEALRFVACEAYHG